MLNSLRRQKRLNTDGLKWFNMDNLKPKIVTGILAVLALALIYLASPDISGLADYRYAVLVPVFTSIIAVSSLYFIHKKLSEVMM